MKRIIIRTTIVTAIAALSLPIVFATSTVNAQIEQTEQTEQTQTTTPEKRGSAQANIAERKAAAETRLSEAKLKACENRQTAIKNIMTRISDRGQKQITLFGKIAERVQAFYVDKGRTLENYDALVANATETKEAAQAAVDATEATAVEFSCDGENPKGIAETFKTNLNAQKTALKDYKTAVKDLIVGVKSVQSTTNSEETTTEENQ